MSYSKDLRSRAVLQYERGPATRRQIADRFEISLATLSRWLHRYRTTGSLQSKPRSGGRKATFTEERLAVLLDLVSAHPDWTLAELAAQSEELLGVPVSVNKVFRALQACAITRKKNAHRQ